MRADHRFKRLGAPAVLALTLALGACGGGAGPLDFASLGQKPEQLTEARASQTPQTELQKATEYWGKQAEKNPRDPQAAINYVRNLKALGAKQQALAAIQQAHSANPAHKGVASEYGRLALELDQVAVADKLLTMADDPVAPDWKVISARGTVLAKQGHYREAIPQFERALALSPNQPTILNNLALAHAMNGQAEKAEPMLRQAAADGSADAKVTQNLSLVLGLQGKHDDAKSVVVRTAAPVEEVADDARLVREMVGTQTATGQPTTARIATSSTNSNSSSKASSKASAKAKLPAQAAAQPATFEDATALVERLANTQSAAPGGPIELGPKR
jgi:Flp pilus assembly protein TadD